MGGVNCWLARGDDLRIRVGPHGVALGRALGNDVVLQDRAASQLHAIVHLGAFGPELLSFGRNGTRVNGVVVEGGAPLSHGDRIDVPGESLGVEVDGKTNTDRAMFWMAARADGALYGLRRPVRVGGGPLDDLVVSEWPPAALECNPVGGALVLQFGADAQIGGEHVAAGEMRLARVGDEVHIRGSVVRLFGQAHCASEATALHSQSNLPTDVVFSFLPSGARLTLSFDRGPATVRLSEVRARLVATLLGAATDGNAGAWVSDDVVISRVWPRNTAKTRVDVNILVHRLRRDLLKLGLNPFAVVEREVCATRFLVADGGSVRIE